MQYQEAVAEARRLVKRSESDQWRLAELSYEQCVQGGKSQVAWAADIGLDQSYVSRLCRLWDHWGSMTTSRPKFSKAYVEIAPTSAREPAIRNLPPEEKAAVVREALDDQDVAVRVLRDPHTRRNVTEAREQVAREIEDTARDRAEADPTSRAIREATQVLTIESNISKARFWLAESARQIQELPDRDADTTERFRMAAGEVDTALGWLRTAIDGGQVTDEELIRLLEGGA